MADDNHIPEPFEEFDEKPISYELTEEQIALREMFVLEYMKDYNPISAARRCGFFASFAVAMGLRFMEEPFVNKLIDKMRSQANTKEREEADRARHLENLKYLSLNGPESSRVSAAKEYAEMRGWKKDGTPAEAAAELVEAFKEIAKDLPV